MKTIIGAQQNPEAIQQLMAVLEPLVEPEATFYVGYPVIPVSDGSVTAPALLVSERHGLIAFTLIEADDTKDSIIERQDSLYGAFQAKLFSFTSLRKRRELAISLAVLTFSPTADAHLGVEDVVNAETLKARLKDCTPIPDGYLRPLNAALERVSALRGKSRYEDVTDTSKRGFALGQIDSEIANLDEWQKAAAIEFPNGPQRIRGLAGSGKTIVLALKAAYLHGQYPDWTFVVTFHTRALKQQFTRLINHFFYQEYGRAPDWEKIRIIHSFGSKSDPGVYSELCQIYGATTQTFGSAKRAYGYDHAFQGICADLLKIVEEAPKPPPFKAILVDEAQDMPAEFLQLCWHSAERHRITWAYDDLQNLSAYDMQDLLHTFGRDSEGHQRVMLRNDEGQPKQDIILPRCYRNPPQALVAAHALGSGVYRTEGLLQHPDDPDLWTDIGYRKVSGELQSGQSVDLERDPSASPSFFDEYLDSSDILKVQNFADEREQFSFAASEIAALISEDLLRPEDILAVFPNAIGATRAAPRFQQVLRDHGVRSQIAGVTHSVDEFSSQGSVTLSGPYRAKGNEAAFVFVLNSTYCAAGPELIKRRNTLFTSITRSKGWIRIYGCGNGMEIIADELKKLSDAEFHLRFTIPTAEELSRMRKQYRDFSPEEKSDLSNFEKSLKSLLSRDPSDVDALLEQLPEGLREQLTDRLSDAID